MLVKAVMRTPIAPVRPDTPLAAAKAAMARDGLSEMPVVDAEGRLVGVLTARDVASASASTMPVLAQWEWPEAADRMRVGETMTRDTWAVGPDATVEEVARDLAARRRAAVPVVDDRRVVGLVVARQLLAARLRERAGDASCRPRRIVARVGCGIEGLAVLAAAGDLVRRHRSQLTVVHVLRAWAGIEDEPVANEMIVDGARAALTALLPADVRDTVRVVTVPGGGSASVVDVAVRDDADLVVADARSACELMTLAPCAVLAIPTGPQAGHAGR